MVGIIATIIHFQVVNEGAFAHFTCKQLVEKTLRGDGKAPFALAKRRFADRDHAIIEGLKTKNAKEDALCMLILAMGPPVTKEGKACLEGMSKPTYAPIIRVYALRSLQRYAEARKVLQGMPKIGGPGKPL